MIRKLELSCPAGLKAFAALRKVAADRDMDLQAVAMRYALERFLARVFETPAPGPLALQEGASFEVGPGSLTLKGGLTMFLAEEVAPLDGRSTSDADFHVVPTADGGHAEQFAGYLREALARPPGEVDDGVRFDLDTLQVKRVRDGVVPGGKVTVACQIGKFPLQLRSDLAFDARPVHELAVPVEFPSVLPASGLPPFTIRRTPFAYTVADKVQAMVRHGAGNYRLRDYYDLYVILTRDKADLGQLPDALQRTFDLYGTALPASVDEIPALGAAFVADKTPRWETERETKHYGSRVPGLPEVVDRIRGSLDPILRGLAFEPVP